MVIFLNILLIILIILVFLFFLIFIVLVTPIKYNVYIEKVKDVHAFGKATWLFRALSIDFVYKKDYFKYNIKIFGRNLNKPKKTKVKILDYVRYIYDNSKEWINRIKTARNLIKFLTKFFKWIFKKSDLKKIFYSKIIKIRLYLISLRFYFVSVFVPNINIFIPEKLKDKYIYIAEQIDYYIYIYNRLNNIPNKNKVLKLLKKFLKKILYRLKPKYFNLETEIGIGTYNTGILLAAIAVFLPSVSHLIKGNFTENIFTTKVSIGGKIRLGRIVVPTLILYFRKDVRVAKNYIKSIFY